MKLQQLRYIWEVAHHDLNVSATAQSLYTSQPGISKQIRLLEDELGVEIFCRSGKHLTQVTPAGKKILQVAGEVLQQIESIKQLAQEHNHPEQGSLTIGVTHTLARYGLPQALGFFSHKYPKVNISLQQGSPDQVAEMVAEGAVDFAFASNGLDRNGDIVMLPCYHWGLSLVVPIHHELAEVSDVSLEQLAEYPLVTYAQGFAGRLQLEKAFADKSLTPRIACGASDSEIIKTYVRMGLGVGVVATMAYENDRDSDLRIINGGHLFEACTASIGLWKAAYLRSFCYQFIEQIASHLTQQLVDEALSTHNRDDRNRLFKNIELPQL